MGTLVKGALKPEDNLLFITPKPGVSVTELHDQIDPITRDLPTIELQDQAGFADAQNKQVDNFLLLIYALLGLSIIIAALGIVNTLALSVIERTREVGLLRAIGLSRRQLRRMVRLESIAIAVLGAVLGILIGIVFGVSLIKALSDQGLDVLSVPWLLLVVFVVIAAVIGMLAAWLPARTGGQAQRAAGDHHRVRRDGELPCGLTISGVRRSAGSLAAHRSRQTQGRCTPGLTGRTSCHGNAVTAESTGGGCRVCATTSSW